MPPYRHLLRDEIAFAEVQRRVDVMAMLGVPYGEASLHNAERLAREQASRVAAELLEQEAIKDVRRKAAKQRELQTKEVVALIAYMQRLGQDIKLASTVVPSLSESMARSSEVRPGPVNNPAVLGASQ